MNDLEYFPHNVKWPERLPLTGSDKQINCRCVMTEAKQEWNGEGLPPVGTECEVECTLYSGFWEPCTILFSGKKFIIADIEGDEFMAPSYITKRFRPIKTEEEKAISDLAYMIRESWTVDAIELAREIYRAGYRKA